MKGLLPSRALCLATPALETYISWKFMNINVCFLMRYQSFAMFFACVVREPCHWRRCFVQDMFFVLLALQRHSSLCLILWHHSRGFTVYWIIPMPSFFFFFFFSFSLFLAPSLSVSLPLSGSLSVSVSLSSSICLSLCLSVSLSLCLSLSFSLSHTLCSCGEPPQTNFVCCDRNNIILWLVPVWPQTDRRLRLWAGSL